MSRTLPLLVLLTLAACKANDSVEKSFDFAAETFDRVDLRATTGTVTVVPEAAGRVDALLQWRGDVTPEVTARLAGQTLVISTVCPPDARSCSVELELGVPAATDMAIEQADGTLQLNGIAGDVDLLLTDGEITLVDVVGDTRVTATDADVILDGMSGRVDVVTDHGTVIGDALSSPTAQVTTEDDLVELDFTVQPDLVDVTTRRGDVTLQLPAGAYEVDATTRRGTLEIDGIDNTSDAGSIVFVQSTAGDVVIDGR